MLLTSGKDSMPFIEKQCLRLFPLTKDQKVRDPGCIHGVGHGLVSLNNLDIVKTLRDCDNFNKIVRSDCWDGAFMEYTASIVPSFNTKDPWKFCSKLDNAYQKKCASYISFMYLKYVPYSTKTFAEMCSKAPNQQLEELCTRWVGYIIAEDSKGSLEYIKKECKSIKSFFESTICLIGAAQEIEVDHYTNWKTLSKLTCAEVPKDFNTTGGSEQ